MLARFFLVPEHALARALVIASVAFGTFVACGGTANDEVFGGNAGGGADGGSAGPDAGPGSGSLDAAAEGGGGNADGGADSGKKVDGGLEGGAKSCAELLIDVDVTRGPAIECIFGSAIEQCGETLEDLCCPATITKVQAGTPEVAAFKRALKAYKASCTPMCPATPCRSGPSKVCVPGGLGASCMQ